MKVKQKKGELSDFILRITPFATDLLFYYLKNKIIELKTVLIESEDGKKISIYSSADIQFINYMEQNDSYLKNIKNKEEDDNFISLSRLIKIKDYYKKKKKGIDTSIENLFSQFRNIEKKVRNKVAHRMINITEKFIKDKVGLSSKEILEKNEELLKKVLKIDNINFVYDEINKKIIDLLQKPKE